MKRFFIGLYKTLTKDVNYTLLNVMWLLSLSQIIIYMINDVTIPDYLSIESSIWLASIILYDAIKEKK